MAPKQYRVGDFVTAEDEQEIAAILKAHPLWSRRDARAKIARRKFAARLTNQQPKP
jgi:hypothetical protein